MNYELLIRFSSTGKVFRNILTVDCIEYRGSNPSRVHVTTEPPDFKVIDVEHTYIFTFKDVVLKAEEDLADISFKIYNKDCNKPVVAFEELDYYLPYTAFKDHDSTQDLELNLALTYYRNSREWIKHILPRLFKETVK